jgi:hypothetical protein
MDPTHSYPKEGKYKVQVHGTILRQPACSSTIYFSAVAPAGFVWNDACAASASVPVP